MSHSLVSPLRTHIKAHVAEQFTIGQHMYYPIKLEFTQCSISSMLYYNLTPLTLK